MRLRLKVPPINLNRDMVDCTNPGVDNRTAWAHYIRHWYNYNPEHFMYVLNHMLIDAGILEEE